MTAPGINPAEFDRRLDERLGPVSQLIAQLQNGRIWDEVGVGATDETTISTSYTNLATAGPTIVVPTSGWWLVEFSIESFRNDGGAGTDAYISFQHGTTNNAADDDRISNGSGQLVPGSCQRVFKLVAGDTLQVKYRVSGSTGRFRGKRTLAARPIADPS
ncbi:minor tail protein [Baekduia alba]|uniref:hypothetical protein n=1 Tax=Baekduia alba TaxID=2997333 RepID=UPI002341E8A2|nr:hypothetical protein [Baekduia alba]WCB94491.1 minor tail protein [Baekduia alba]